MVESQMKEEEKDASEIVVALKIRILFRIMENSFMSFMHFHIIVDIVVKSKFGSLCVVAFVKPKNLAHTAMVAAMRKKIQAIL